MLLFFLNTVDSNFSTKIEFLKTLQVSCSTTEVQSISILTARSNNQQNLQCERPLDLSHDV
ncbi:hypothetical protein MtrunA17_Chr4g0025791 [Medicago truncatula]|uniref:Uncharacterized protein n=1 Tax=Medicago truncatula TaxID=3880 RepID=A0A396I865_MEDTR|nr:hypothetical protein MtrunA17_Chr4g0025791 [Medicago truncatula]